MLRFLRRQASNKRPAKLRADTNRPFDIDVELLTRPCWKTSPPRGTIDASRRVRVPSLGSQLVGVDGIDGEGSVASRSEVVPLQTRWHVPSPTGHGQPWQQQAEASKRSDCQALPCPCVSRTARTDVDLPQFVFVTSFWGWSCATMTFSQGPRGYVPAPLSSRRANLCMFKGSEGLRGTQWATWTGHMLQHERLSPAICRHQPSRQCSCPT